jgi:hypothetical protein
MIYKSPRVVSSKNFTDFAFFVKFCGLQPIHSFEIVLVETRLTLTLALSHPMGEGINTIARRVPNGLVCKKRVA